jgi:hypothetical protein
MRRWVWIAALVAGLVLGMLTASLSTEHSSCALTAAADATEACMRRALTQSEGWRIVRTDRLSENVVIVTLERPRLRLPA